MAEDLLSIGYFNFSYKSLFRLNYFCKVSTISVDIGKSSN